MRPLINVPVPIICLDTCRIKRNTAEYDYIGVAAADDVDELIDFVKELRETIIKWLEEKHPQLVSGKL